MTLTIKEPSSLDSLTKPTSATGSSDSDTGQNTRSNPVCLEVPVTIRSLPGEKGETSSGSAKPTREDARTVIVFDNGAVLRLAGNFPTGQAVIVSNPQGRDVVCRVVSARNLPTVKGYIEVEFLEPTNDFWGIHQAAGQTTGQKNVSNPPAQQQVVAQPQVAPSEPVPEPPAPSRVAPAAPETISPTGNAPSFEDIAGLVRMSSPPTARGKATESTSRFPASRNLDESTHDSVEAARPYSAVSPPAPIEDLTSLSSTWEGTPTAARIQSPSGDYSGKSMFSSAQTASVSSSSGSRGKTPIIVAGAAVFLIGLGTGLFFMHRGSVAAPPAPVPVASQPSAPVLPAATSAPEPALSAQHVVEPAPVPSPVVSPAPIVSRESAPAPAPAAAPQTPRHQTTTAEAKEPERPAQRSQPVHDLKMSAPTAESRAGRLVDGSVPNIADVTTTSAVMGTPGGGLVPSIAHTENQPAPPVAFASASATPTAKVARDPRLISSTRPVYPAMAKQSNVEGDVTISADIDATGKVVGAKAVGGPMFLRQAAVDAVREWKYEPALVNGKPGAAQITIKIQFRLK
jgi:protein TonB